MKLSPEKNFDPVDTLCTLCEEFSETYKIDALGMSVENLIKRVSDKDKDRLKMAIEGDKNVFSI